MKVIHTYWVMILVLPLLSFLGLEKLWEKKTTYIYSEVTGNKEVTTTWTVEKKGKVLVISGIDKNSKTYLTMDNNYQLQNYQFITTDGQSNYTITRKDSQLICSGTVKGQTMQRTQNIGNKNWIQQFGFGLRKFAMSKERNVTFISVNPKDFSTNTLIAKKNQITHLKIGNTLYHAEKMIITLTGFESLFWKAEIWFNPDDGTFLQYSGNEGPNTPTTTIRFESEKK